MRLCIRFMWLRLTASIGRLIMYMGCTTYKNFLDALKHCQLRSKNSVA
jgi:hypothetical protein